MPSQTYCISFRLSESENSDDYKKRLEYLDEWVGNFHDNGGPPWKETTSFYVLTSCDTLDELCEKIRQYAKLKGTDAVLVIDVENKRARFIGQCDDPTLLKSLIPCEFGN